MNSFTNLVTDLHVCVFFFPLFLCSSMFVSIIPGSDISVSLGRSERLCVLFGGSLSSLPSHCFEFFSFADLAALPCSPLPGWRRQKLSLHAKFCHFTVSFLISASVFTWLLHVCPSSVWRLFQLCASVKAKFHCVDRISGFSISEDKNTMLTRSAVSAVFRLSRRLRFASLQPLRCCSVSATGGYKLFSSGN